MSLSLKVYSLHCGSLLVLHNLQSFNNAQDVYSAQHHTEEFHCLKACTLPGHQFLSLTPDNHSFYDSIILPFPECRIVGIIHYNAFSDWLLSFGDTHLSLHHVFLCGLIAYFFLTLYNILCLEVLWFIYPFIY